MTLTTCLSVSDPKADLTVHSGDGVAFKVFSKDLETYSDVFPSREALSDTSEEIVLPETAKVLELLFQFTRRQRQPDLRCVKFAIIAQLAEAVEKYEVFTAIELCKTHMRSVRYHTSSQIRWY